MAADGGDSGHVIDSDAHNDLLREFFDFGDDLVLPDKPFEVKKEGNEYEGSGIDFDVNHFGSVDDPSDDFFMGATPSPSSSSTTSSSAASGAMTSSAPPTRSNSGLAFAMSIANDFMNIDFEGAADVDIGNLDDDLDIMGGYDSMAALTTDKSLAKTPIDPCHIKIEDEQHVEKKEMKKSDKVTPQENVQILTDLNQPLKIVRSKLEERFNFDLSSYTIWLQDSTLLNDESTLSEQCVEGTGIVKVQLNIQPVNKDGHHKINIVDVLKIGPEDNSGDKNGVESGDEISTGNLQDFDDEDDDFFDDDEIVDPVGSVDDDPVTNFVESVDFCQLRKRFNYPDSVAQWTKLHTFHWAKWVNKTFPGVRLNEAKWNIDGKDFTAMSESDFTLMVGHDPGNLLWSHFTLLRQTGMATVPSSQPASTEQLNVAAPHFNSFGAMLQRQHFAAHGSKQTYDMAAAASVTGFGAPMPKKQRVILGKYEEGRVFINSDDSSNVHRTGNNGSNVQLWKFLLDILTDYRHRNIIRWSLGSEEGEFVMTEPEGVARLWGEQKGKCTMNYEKLSRALRYYKGGNILDKVHNKKFTYRFVCDLRDIVGFSATELNDRVREQASRAESVKNDPFF